MRKNTEVLLEEAMYKLIEEFKIPEDTKKKIRSRTERKRMYEKYGDKAFLDPDNLAFPVVDPDTGKYDCNLIYAAYLRASLYSKKGTSAHEKEYYIKIRMKAKELYIKNRCYRQLNIEISENNSVDVMDLFELLVESQIEEMENIIEELM